MKDQFKKIIKVVFEDLLKPLGYKKDGQNFRLIQEDGLGKIINFQLSLYNSAESSSFTVNTGIYFEKENVLENKKFKEYECLLRQRPACISKRYGKDTWWEIEKDTDIELLLDEIKIFVQTDALKWLDRFCSKNDCIEQLLNGEAYKEDAMKRMNLSTAKVLVDMGYGERVLPHIREIEGEFFQALVNEIET